MTGTGVGRMNGRSDGGRMRRLGLAIGALSLWAAPAGAQTLEAVPTAVEELAVVEAEGAPGVTLSVVGRTPGVPVVLHAVRGRGDSPIAGLTVENTATQALTHLALAVTWTPPGDTARRRVVVLPVAIPAATTTRVSLDGLDGASRLIGLTGAIEVALAGARTVDGARYRGSPGPVWGTGQSQIACADAQWQAYAKDAEMADQATGALVRCAADGQWRSLDGVDAEREQ
jgi:hypothetical protein